MFHLISEISESESDIEFVLRLNIFGLRVFEERRKGKEEIIDDIKKVVLRSSDKKKSGKKKQQKEKGGGKTYVSHDRFGREGIEELSFLYRIFTFIMEQSKRASILSLREIEIYMNMDMLMSPDIIHFIGVLQSAYEDVMKIGIREKFCVKFKFRIKAMRSFELVFRIFLEFLRMKLRRWRM